MRATRRGLRLAPAADAGVRERDAAYRGPGGRTLAHARFFARVPRARVARAAFFAVLAACCLPAFLAHAQGSTPEARFRAANERLRGGDYPGAIAGYRELAASGAESAPLYWNWAQAASARGATGEALWALLRAREIDPSDRAVRREIERLRDGANLDPAEISPEPLAAVARGVRRYRLDLVAVALLAISLGAHVEIRRRRSAVGLGPLVWTTLVLGVLAAGAPVSGALARPTGAVVRRGAPLLDAASPSAEAVGTLREGEVVPILESSGEYVRVEDSSGARGWAHAEDVRSLVAPPRRFPAAGAPTP